MPAQDEATLIFKGKNELGKTLKQINKDTSSLVDKLGDSTKKLGQSSKKASEGFDKLKTSSSQAGQSFKSTSNNSSSLVTSLGGMTKVIGGVAAGAIAAGAAMKQAFDLGREGATITQTGQSFDLLLDKISAAPDLLNQLRTASSGTINDLELMSSTSTLLAGTQGELATALANSTPKLLEIAKAAQKLNPALGDTTFLYQSLATGIKRSSPLILDNLGLTIKIGEANETFAQSIGKTVAELSAAEKQQALLNATLKAGDVLINQVGGSVESNTDAYDRFATNVDNAKGRLLAYVNDAVNPAVSALNRLLFSTEETNRLLSAQGGGAMQAGESWDEYANRVTNAVIEGGKLTESSRDLFMRFLEGQDIADGFRVRFEKLSQSMGFFTKAQIEAIQATESFDRVLMLGQETSLRSEEVVRDLKQAYDDFSLAIDGPIGEAIDTFNEKQVELRDRARDITRRIEELEGRRWLTSAQKEELATLKKELQEVDQAVIKNAETVEESTRRIILSMLEKRLAMDGFTSEEIQLLTQLGETWGLLDEGTALAVEKMNQAVDEFNANNQENIGATIGLLDDAISGVLGLTGAVNAMPTAHQILITTVFSTVGRPPDIPGGPRQSPAAAEATRKARTRAPGPTAPSRGDTGVAEFATGGTFVIPPRMSSNAVNLGGGVMAEPGERVTVETRGQQIGNKQRGSTGGNIIFQPGSIVVNDRVSMAHFISQIKTLQSSRINSFMGG